MTVKEFIEQVADDVPRRFSTEDGRDYQIELMWNEKEKDYSIFLWEVVRTVKDHLVTFALGDTVEEARTKLIYKIKDLDKEKLISP